MIPVPILLPGEKTSTRVDPGKSLYAQVAPAANQEGIIDAAIWIGYAWADEPRNHAVVMVTGDDQQKVKNTAEDLANSFWKVRNEFEFIAPTATLKESLDMAIMALTPGGVDQDLERLEFKRITRPMFPFDKNMTDPDLSVRLVPLSDQ